MSEKLTGLYDLHNHLLFGIDDGAQTLEDTEAMLKEAAENGITLIAATPHMLPRTDMVKYRANLPAVVETAEKYGIKVVQGGEYNARSFPENPPYISLGGGANGYVLMDFRMPSFPPEFQLCVDNIFNANYTLIIAHPERTFPESMLPELGRLAECGVVYQVTAGSLLGKFGAAAKRMAWLLLEKKWAKIVASDSHDVEKRPSYMQEAYQMIARKYGMQAALTLKENARKVIEEPTAMLEGIVAKRSFFSFLNWFGR